jgi:hypothetical protein
MTGEHQIVPQALAAGAGSLAGAALWAPAAYAQSPSAGGGELGQVIGGSIGGTIIAAAMIVVVSRYQAGKLPALERLSAFAERSSGLPGWCSLPIAVITGALLIAVFGMYWDISIHLDEGRDPGPFANTAHYFILAGLFGIVFAGMLAIALPRDRPGPAAVRIRSGWSAPVGGVLIFACGLFGLSGFPLDDIWHRIFGQDVTLWGPTHLLLFGAAGLSTIGAGVLLVEGRLGRGEETPRERPRFLRFRQAALAGSLLIALSTFQGEFDFAVPQFRLDWHPILLAFAASVALVAARIQMGRGGALLAVAFFIAVRGVLALLVGPLFGHSTLYFPPYIVEALVVEAVAFGVSVDKPLRFGAIAGLAVGLIGYSANWALSLIWWTLPWTATMLPEALLATVVTGVAGGVIGGFIGAALTRDVPERATVPRWALAVSALATVGVTAWALPMSDQPPIKAAFQLQDVTPPPQRTVTATIKLDPPDAADGARWFTVTSWQGGGSVVDMPRKVGPGTYRTTRPIPAYDNWKTTLRLQKGSSYLGLPLWMPEDPAIPAPMVPADPSFTRTFVYDKQNAQREQTGGSSALTIVAYLTVLIIALGLVASLYMGLSRLERRSGRVAVSARSGP